MKPIVLNHDKKLQLLGWPSILFGLIIAYKVFLSENFSPEISFVWIFSIIVVIVTISAFVIGGGYIVLMALFSRVEFDENEIRYRSSLGRKINAPWSAIERVSFGSVSQELVLKTNFGRIKSHNWSKNFRKLKNEIENRKLMIDYSKKF